MIVPPTLQAKNVTVRLGERALLNDVTLTLPSGSMTVLLGPNGAGKTTLIRVLAGILPATAGDIFLGSLRLRAWDVRRLPSIVRTCRSKPARASR